MRLWHKSLIPYLPRQQLLGQWRECCAIARNIAVEGTPNHVLVNKVLGYQTNHFWKYGYLVHKEMEKRGYKSLFSRFEEWIDDPDETEKVLPTMEELFDGWHNDRYLYQCLANLQEKADCGAIPAEEWKLITDRWPGIK